MDTICKDDAKFKGFKKFFTGKPCKNGHTCERYVRNEECIECIKESQNKYYQNNPDKIKQASKDWADKNKDKRTGYVKKYRLKRTRTAEVRDYNRKRAGLPEPTRPCPDTCDCCNKPETKRHKSGTLMSLCLDHNHATGEFRGWLCNKCNLMIGNSNNNEATLMDGISYLRRTV